jgi:FtsP/CotA-like multicopper oxidase with cupredoxin domain
MHWHGIEVPIEQDGVPWVSQRPIGPGETYTYEFTVHQEGTFFYHAHSAMQEMIGLIGMFIAHPREAHSPAVDHDYGIVLQEWAVLPNNSVPNTANMEFNWLTFNGVAAPLTTPLLARHWQPRSIAFCKSRDGSPPIHLHGNQFVTTGTEGGRAPESTWYPSNTVLGRRRTGARCGIRRQVSWRMDDSLPSAAPHDELDDGSAARPPNHDLRSNGG